MRTRQRKEPDIDHDHKSFTINTREAFIRLLTENREIKKQRGNVSALLRPAHTPSPPTSSSYPTPSPPPAPRAPLPPPLPPQPPLKQSPSISPRSAHLRTHPGKAQAAEAPLRALTTPQSHGRPSQTELPPASRKTPQESWGWSWSWIRQ